MSKLLVCYAATLVTLLVVDGIWLGVVARNLYQTQLAYHMADKINFVAAAAFYIIYPIGIVYFAGAVGLETGSWQDALVRGAILGVMAYGAYDLTNLATFKAFPVQIAVIDMAWGTFLTAVSAAVGVLVARNVG